MKRKHLHVPLIAGMLLLLLSGTAQAAGFGTTIVERFWDSLTGLVAGRMQSQTPVILPMLQDAEALFLGPTSDLSLNPAVMDVFSGMRVAGLLLLAFCTVISLAEITEGSITGNSMGLVTWFKRFLVASLMTFGGIHVYAIWIRLFNALLYVFRNYLDTHWTGTAGTGDLYQQLVNQLAGSNLLLVMGFVGMTVIVLIILAVLVGGVRVAELILSIVIAPIVWPVYMIPSMEDIPRTALRGFLGLNALLLFTVAMVRTALRLALAPGLAVNIWSLIPALSMLVMTIFLPATIKRLVGQGHTGVGALMMAVNLASGLKLLSLGMGAKAAAAAPAAASVTPAASTGASAYPMATLSGNGGMASAPAQRVYESRASIPLSLPNGAVRAGAPVLNAPPRSEDLCIDLGESMPGSGRFDTVMDIRRMDQGPPIRTKSREEERR